MDAADEPVVLSPALGRVWWGLVAVTAVLYAVAMVVITAQHHTWHLLPLVLVFYVVVALVVLGMRRLVQVRLADGVLIRRSGRIRISASEIAAVSTAPAGGLRRGVVVETRTGDLVPLGLAGPDAHHAVVAARTIRQWAERNGADFSRVAVGPVPLADGTVLRSWRLPLLAVCWIVVPWIALVVRSMSLRPPWWVLACGVLGAVPAVVLLVRLARMQACIDGDELVVVGLHGEVRIPARSVAGVDLDANQYLRVLRTDRRPVSLSVRGRTMPGLPGRLMAWAQVHGGGVGQPFATQERAEWGWWAAYLAGVGLVLTPLYWALTPDDLTRGLPSLVGILVSAMAVRLLNGRRSRA